MKLLKKTVLLLSVLSGLLSINTKKLTDLIFNYNLKITRHINTTATKQYHFIILPMMIFENSITPIPNRIVIVINELRYFYII